MLLWTACSISFAFWATIPEQERRRDELRPGYRSFPFGAYLIFYKIIKPGVRISHVVHGRRDLPRYRFDK